MEKAPRKVDAVVEAVHYTPEGKIDFVRLHERRGAVFGDHILVRREDLMQRLRAKQVIYSGRRLAPWGNQFELGAPLRLVNHNGGEWVRCGEDDSAEARDLLKGVPVL